MGIIRSPRILGKEAFTAAADPTKFPEQLAYVQPWQAKRLMQNPIGVQQTDQKGKARNNVWRSIVGDYSPELGYSYGEIGGISRSTNRSQGQGTAERKGSQKQALITVAGDKATKDLFDGIDITWNRIPGGAPVGSIAEARRWIPLFPRIPRRCCRRWRRLAPCSRGSQKAPKIRWPRASCRNSTRPWRWPAVYGSKRKRLAPPSPPVRTLRVNDHGDPVRSPAQVTLTGVSLTGMEGAPALNLAPVVLANNQPSNYTLNVQVSR